MGFRGTGAAGAGQLRLKWRHLSPALTLERKLHQAVRLARARLEAAKD